MPPTWKRNYHFLFLHGHGALSRQKKGQISEEVALKRFARGRMDDYARSVHATQL